MTGFQCTFQSSLTGEVNLLNVSVFTQRYDAVLYSRALGNRSPGTHNLCLIEDADHNFSRPRVQFPSHPALNQMHDLFFDRTEKQSSRRSWSGTERSTMESARLESGNPGCGPGCKRYAHGLNT